MVIVCHGITLMQWVEHKSLAQEFIHFIKMEAHKVGWQSKLLSSLRGHLEVIFVVASS
jgi:hypothetical protein